MPSYKVFEDSILRIISMVFGRYLIVGYLDPWGSCSSQTGNQAPKLGTVNWVGPLNLSEQFRWGLAGPALAVDGVKPDPGSISAESGSFQQKGLQRMGVCMYIYIYTYVCACAYVYIHTYTSICVW